MRWEENGQVTRTPGLETYDAKAIKKIYLGVQKEKGNSQEITPEKKPSWAPKVIEGNFKKDE